MAGTYFDAVLTKDMYPIFTGTPDEVHHYLETHDTDDSIQVCPGRTLRPMSVEDYKKTKEVSA